MMLDVRSIKKQFGDLTAVHDVSFSAAAGQIFGIIGPNGAGKSTIIRMIVNILVPDSGTILFDGRRISEEDKNRIGYLPEERGLYGKVTVKDMLLYLSALKGKSGDRVEIKMDGLLDRFGLLEWKNNKIEELSKGMSQKIQFIAALVHEPEILFFDEPFSGLDPVSTDTMREIILELGKEGKIILFSTHNMESAERICSDILLINRGREMVNGSLEKIKKEYGTNSIVLEFDGQGDFISSLPYVENLTRYPRWIELELADGEQPGRLLEDINHKIRLLRFEIQQPSLHKIFVDMVKGSDADEGPADV